MTKPKISEYINSYYSATATLVDDFASLQGEEAADVCIIGGGYTGLSCALHLAKQGVRVALLEAEKVAWGASGRNGGHVGTGQRRGQLELAKEFGLQSAKRFWQYGLDAKNLVASLIEEHQIDCDLKKGILHVAAKKSDVAYYKSSTEDLHKNYGYDEMQFVEKTELNDMLGTHKFYAGQLDNGALHLHPLNYALGLAKAAKAIGVKIYENSRVTSYKNSIEEGVKKVVVSTDRGRIKSKYMVLACNGYLERLEPKIAGKIMPINNFVLATEPLSNTEARALIRDDVAVQDSLFVVNYWKLSGDNRLIFGGGENYSKRFPRDIKKFVQKYMLRIYPQLEKTKIDYAWGGTLAISMSRLPHLDKLPLNIYSAQGYSGHGVPTATFAGKLIADAIVGNSDKFDNFAKLPAPTFPGGTLLRWPGLVAGMLYHSMLDKL